MIFMYLEIRDLPAEVHQLVLCEYFIHPESDAAEVIAAEEARMEDINGEEMIILHDDFTIGLIT